MQEKQDFISKEIKELEAQGLKRKMRTLDSPQGVRVCIKGKEFLNFCSNDYLGLANDFRLKEAAAAALKSHGTGSGASRLVCGNMRSHESLQDRIARFKGAEACLMFSCGYMANVGIISALFGRGDIIFSDRLNHASIIDGILLSRATMKRYAHCDMNDLGTLLRRHQNEGRQKLIVTDSVFSMDGDRAPLSRIVALAKEYGCWVMIDEAHALGVMGKNGEGLAEETGVASRIDIGMGTLSKAAGSYGAYCCGSRALMDLIVNKARSFIYTTGLPPAVAAASLAGIELIAQGAELRKRLWDNTHYVQAALVRMGWDTMQSDSPIIPLLIGNAGKAVELSNQLLEAGILISAIRPPTVPSGTARLRLTVTAAHQRKELDYLLDRLQVLGQQGKLLT